MSSPRPYVSIDLETTGLDSSFCQVIEFGAVIEDWKSPVEALPRFHAYIYHDQIVGEPFALQMNAAILKKLASVEKEIQSLHYRMGKVTKDGEVFMRPVALPHHFAAWLEKNGVNPEESILAAGKNFASFDRQFLQRLYGWNISFHHRSIDPAMMYWKPSVDNTPPSTKTCMERAGIPGEVAHTAVEDAIGVIKLVRYAFVGCGEPIFDTPEFSS